MTNKEKEILEKLRKDIRNKSHICYTPSCNELAIRSHIQQAEGAIRNIAKSEGKVVQIEDLNFFNKNIYGFKEKGIKQKGDVLTFWGFCNLCDTKIFSDIEKKNTDYSNYRNQLLFSYRGFLSEFYKIEYNAKWDEKIMNSNNLSEDLKNKAETSFVKNIFKLKVSKSLKLQLENDLNYNTRNFEFINFQLPRIEVCTSSIYSFPTKILLTKDLLIDIQEREILPSINSTMFFNLIPTKDKLEVIIGCTNDPKLEGKIDLKEIAKYDEKSKIKLISDILIKHTETWFVSKSLYKVWKNRKLDIEIIKQIEEFRPPFMKNKYVKFNMFQGV